MRGRQANQSTRNAIETVRVKEGVVSIDHTTGVMTAKWDNGSTETWSPCRRGYSLEEAIKGHRAAIERWSE